MTRSKKICAVLFSVAFIAICLLPFVGMLWHEEESVSGDGESVAPGLIAEDGSLNSNILNDLGDYFENNYAYRSNAIDANARMRVALFQTSPTDQVIVGSDGWLYYGGTLDDYLARDPITESDAEMIAHNVALMQGYANAKGSDFIFTISPNKNSLYPAHMPYYLVDGQSQSMDMLKVALESKGVKYVDLFELFDSIDEELYPKNDSHWNVEGAYLVSNELLEAAGKPPIEYVVEYPSGATTYNVENMLYPTTGKDEPWAQLDAGVWSYTDESTTAEDESSDTVSESDGTLLMYRDSFGNSLIPVFAASYGEAHFSKLIPYNFTMIDSLRPDCVIVERVERHADLFLVNPPLMPAPKTKVAVSGTVDSSSGIQTYVDGDFRVVEGWLDEAVVGEGDEVFIQIETASGEVTTYVPYYISSKGTEYPLYENSDSGFRMYLIDSDLPKGEYIARILLSGGTSEECIVVKQELLQLL